MNRFVTFEASIRFKKNNLFYFYLYLMAFTYRRRPFLITYFKLGYLLHLMTIAEVLCIYACFQYFHLAQLVQTGNIFFNFFCALCLICPPFFPQCDARSRFQNYKQVKDYLFLYGFQTRIIKPFSFSRCQRDAVLAAAEELGLKKRV